MGYTWVKGSRTAFASLPEVILAKLRAKGLEIMTEVIKQAVEDMRRFTESRPSAKSGKQGRVETGQMLDAIAGRVQEEGDRIIGQFGFLDRQDLYFALQTSLGFTHTGGAFIEPTFAQRDAQRIAIESLLGKLNSTL